MLQFLKFMSFIPMIFLASCQFIPLLTSPEAVTIEEEIVEDIINDIENPPRKAA